MSTFDVDLTHNATYMLLTSHNQFFRCVFCFEVSAYIHAKVLCSNQAYLRYAVIPLFLYYLKSFLALLSEIPSVHLLFEIRQLQFLSSPVACGCIYSEPNESETKARSP